MSGRQTIRHKARELTAKQRKFALEYAASMCAARAARAAGYSAKSARFQASRMLRNVAVRAEIDQLLAASFAKTQLTVERLDQSVAEIAFADIRLLFDEHGQLLPMERWPDSIAMAVAALDTIARVAGKKRTVIRKIRLADKMAALALGMKRLGMLSDTVRLSGTLTLEQLVMQSMQPKEGPAK